MDAIYYLSSTLLVIALLGLPVLLIILLVKPHIVNNRSFIKKPLSRGKILGVMVLALTISLFGFGGVMAATEPSSVKAERIVRQQNEEKARQQQALEKQKQQDEEKRKADEARRPVVKQESKTEKVTFTTVEEQDATLPKGERRTAVEGVDGERKISYDVTYENGIETKRTETGNVISKEPTTKVVKVGTYVAPAPALAPVRQAQPSQPAAGGNSGTSAYYRNCSAARAAGAAPVYRGQPGYGRHLDRDNDGVGCE